MNTTRNSRSRRKCTASTAKPSERVDRDTSRRATNVGLAGSGGTKWSKSCSSAGQENRMATRSGTGKSCIHASPVVKAGSPACDRALATQGTPCRVQSRACLPLSSELQPGRCTKLTSRAARPLPFIRAPATPGTITDEAADVIAAFLLDYIDEQDRQRCGTIDVLGEQQEPDPQILQHNA